MGQIAFWGIQHGLGVTSNTAAVASILGLEYQIKTLVSQPQWSDHTLEHAFKNSITKYNREFVGLTGSGLDNLERVVRSNKLERDSIKNNSLLVEPDRLDFLKGSEKISRDEFEEAYQIYENIYKRSNDYYQAVLLDVHSGLNSKVSEALLSQSDLIVVCINQNISILEKYFTERAYWPQYLQEKPHILLIGQYDSNSKYKVRNITNKYRYKGKVFTLPYNTEFRDYFNDGDIKGFFSKYRAGSKYDPNFAFIEEVRKLSRTILDEIGVNTQIKHIERGVS